MVIAEKANFYCFWQSNKGIILLAISGGTTKKI
jgi:hypothetical protein